MKAENNTSHSLRKPLILGMATLVILVFGFGLWSVSTQLYGAVIASGQIEVESNRQALQHPDGGVVLELMVNEGERVERGEVLLRLDPSALRTEYAVVQARLVEAQARRARLQSELEGEALVDFPQSLLAGTQANEELSDLIESQQNLFEARRRIQEQEHSQMHGRIAQIRSQIQGLDAQTAAIDEQIELVRNEYELRSGLFARGNSTREPLLRLQQDMAQLEGSRGEITARRAEALERIIEIETQMLQLDSQRQEAIISDLRETRLSIQEQMERLADLERRLDQTELRAPVDGYIHGLSIFGPQSVLRPADPLAYLVPEGRPMVITARIPATDVDQVYPGQLVSLMFPAFDQRDLPEIKGYIGQVSADAFTDDRTGSSYYRSEILMEEDQIALLGNNALLPGMPVEAFIQTHARTPLAYLLEPFTVYFSRAFRES